MTPDDTCLDALLREGLARPELPDGGFTRRVRAALPNESAMPCYRPLIALGWIGSIIGALVALGACVPWIELSEASYPLGASTSGLPPHAWVVVALSLTMAGGAAAWFFGASALES